MKIIRSRREDKQDPTSLYFPDRAGDNQLPAGERHQILGLALRDP